MTERILRDIRFYEHMPGNYAGKFDGILGNVYQNTSDTEYIGQRIARKLNELNFVSGIFDHIYVCLSPSLEQNEMQVSETELDNRLKSVNYGVKPSIFNSLSDFAKDKWAKQSIFKALRFLFKSDGEKARLISQVEDLITKYNQEIQISYKSKETKSYKVDLSYQIKPNGQASKMLITYLNKKENTASHGSINLISYEDVYSLVDTITVNDNTLVLNPKKSNIAHILSSRYKTPLTIKIEELHS